jgi:hypothetical protein
MSGQRKITPLAVLVLAAACWTSATLAGQSSTRAYAQLEPPRARATPALTADEVSKLKKDLAGARDRQNSHAKKDAAPATSKKH